MSLLSSKSANPNISWRSVRQNRRRKKAEKGMDLKGQKTIPHFFEKKSPVLAVKTESEKRKAETEIIFDIFELGTMNNRNT